MNTKFYYIEAIQKKKLYKFVDLVVNDKVYKCFLYDENKQKYMPVRDSFLVETSFKKLIKTKKLKVKEISMREAATMI